MKPTKNGYDFYEVISALQKDVRRGNEESALYWAFELLETNSFMLQKRLKTIIYEDVSVGDKAACIFSLLALNDMVESLENNQNGVMELTNVILTLCRAKKSRDADNLSAIIRKRRHDEKLDIPDYAIDKHTSKGKALGRDLDHFFEEGAKLSNDCSNKEYAILARKVWKTDVPKINPDSLNQKVPKGQKRLVED